MRIAVVATAAFLVLTTPPARAQDVLIVGWDAAGLANVEPMLLAGELPGLQSLVEAGAVLVPVDVHGRTDTGNMWTQYFTGMDYDQSGVTGRAGLDEELDGTPPRRYSLKDHVFTGMRFYLEEIDFKRTLFGRMRLLADYSFGWYLSKEMPWFNQLSIEADETLTALPNGLPGDYQAPLTDAALAFLAREEPAVAFLHFDPDWFGHRLGENSEDYLADIRASDAELARVLGQIDLESTIVVVMADHGFDEGSDKHWNADDAWLVTTLPIDPLYSRAFGAEDPAAWATGRDFSPTLLEALGLDASGLKPRLRGHSLLAD